MNLVIAQFVVTPDVCEDDFRWLLGSTPAHIVVLLFEGGIDWKGEARKELCDMIQRVVGEDIRFRWQQLERGALLTHRQRVDAPKWISWLHEEGCFYDSLRVDITQSHFNPAASVTVAVMYTTPAAVAASDAFPDAFLEKVAAAIKNEHVRFLAGTFGNRKNQVGKLCKAARTIAPTPFFQPWWMPQAAEEGSGAEEGSDAVAAAQRWNVNAADVRKYKVYPSYIMVFRPCQDSPGNM